MPATINGTGWSDITTGASYSGQSVSFVSDTSVNYTLTDSAHATYEVGDSVTLSISGSDNQATYQGYIIYNGDYYPVCLPLGGDTQLILGINTNGTGTFYSAAYACFLAGTCILTPSGEVAVESLQPGDRVVTRFGALRPVKWIGVQNFAGRFLGRRGAPVRFLSGSLGEATPARDLLVSPDHSVVVGDYLVPARLLVNGVTITQDAPPERVDYYHVDLGEHDCIMADGAWAESYAEQNNRASFHNFVAFQTAHPAHEQRFQTMCMEQVEGTHPVLQDLRAVTAARIPAALKTADPDLHLMVDGRRVAPVTATATTYEFRLPRKCASVRLCSRTIVPATLGLPPDYRRLGFSVTRMTLAGAGWLTPEPITGFEECGGFHPADADGRYWTDGDAELPTLVAQSGGATLAITGFAVPCYLVDPPLVSTTLLAA